MDFPLSVELIIRSRHTVRIGVSEFCGNWMTVTSCLTCLFHQGEPFPQNEANAMDVVIQFAIHKLGFQLSDIIVYAWSIGGFTGTTRPEWCHTLFKKFSYLPDAMSRHRSIKRSTSTVLSRTNSSISFCYQGFSSGMHCILKSQAAKLFINLYSFLCDFLSYPSQLGSDVVPRDPVSRAGCLLRWPAASGPEGHAWQLEWVQQGLD